VADRIVAGGKNSPALIHQANIVMGHRRVGYANDTRYAPTGSEGFPACSITGDRTPLYIQLSRTGFCIHEESGIRVAAQDAVAYRGCMFVAKIYSNKVVSLK